MKYKVIRSKRKTISASVNDGCIVVVRAPYGCTASEIENFLSRKYEIINKFIENKKAALKAAEKMPTIDGNEVKRLEKLAAAVLPPRVEYYAALLGVSYVSITTGCHKSQWGSCSSSGKLCFNCLLMLAPPNVINYVVVHELCHRFEMNHSKNFYAHIEGVIPEWREAKKWLDVHGNEILLARRLAAAKEGQ